MADPEIVQPEVTQEGGVLSQVNEPPTTLTPAQQTAQVTDAAQPRNITSKETVAGQLEGILSQSSPLITQARTKAAETANKRGLLNSSMAVQAGEAAVIDKALPIAQQDATTYATSGQSSQDFVQQGLLSKQQAAQGIAEISHKADVSAALATHESGLKTDFMLAEMQAQEGLSQADAERELIRMAEEGSIDELKAYNDSLRAQALARVQSELDMAVDSNNKEWDMAIRNMMEQNALDIATLQDLGNTTRAAMEDATKRYMTVVDATTSEKTAVISMASNLGTTFQNNLLSIATSNLTEAQKEAAMTNARAAYHAALSTNARMGGIDVTWDSASLESPSWTTPSTAAPSGATPSNSSGAGASSGNTGAPVAAGTSKYENPNYVPTDSADYWAFQDYWTKKRQAQTNSRRSGGEGGK